MFDIIKNYAAKKLKEKILSSSLGVEATEAAEEGSSEVLSGIVGKLQSGDLSTIVSLFSNDGNATEENGAFQDLVGKLSGVLEKKGMSAEEAKAEASTIAPDLIDGIKDKFSSTNDEDSDFDINQLGSLLGEDTSSLFEKAKNLL